MGNAQDPNLRFFNKYLVGIGSGQPEYDYTCKEKCINQHIMYMLNRTQSMFRWSGLPDTIPERVLELYLQTNGNVCFAEYNGKLYVFVGGLGGEPDVYYMPTIYTVSNPALRMSENYRIGENCVVIPNDSLYIGLLPMFSRYSTGMVETELSIKIATINSRLVELVSAPDDRTKASAEKFFSDLAAGKQGVIAENAFLNGIRAQPYGTTGNTNAITNLIELEQYFRASWFNDLGLNANYNMKRESLNSAESQLNNDALLPLVDDMLRCRQIGIGKVNDMFGTNISVALASSWEDNVQELELEHESISGQPENIQERGDVDVSGETS